MNHTLSVFCSCYSFEEYPSFRGNNPFWASVFRLQLFPGLLTYRLLFFIEKTIIVFDQVLTRSLRSKGRVWAKPKFLRAFPILHARSHTLLWMCFWLAGWNMFFEAISTTHLMRRSPLGASALAYTARKRLVFRANAEFSEYVARRKIHFIQRAMSNPQ